jgi:hypothetical protein
MGVSLEAFLPMALSSTLKCLVSWTVSFFHLFLFLCRFLSTFHIRCIPLPSFPLFLFSNRYTLWDASHLYFFIFIFFCSISDFKSQRGFIYDLLCMESRIWHTSFALHILVHYTSTIFYIPITLISIPLTCVISWFAWLVVKLRFPDLPRLSRYCFFQCLCIHHLPLYLPVLTYWWNKRNEKIITLSSDPLPKLRVATIPLLCLITPRGEVRTFLIGVSMGYWRCKDPVVPVFLWRIQEEFAWHSRFQIIRLVRLEAFFLHRNNQSIL